MSDATFKRNGPTPQPVVDALMVIADYLSASGFGGCVVAPEGGAAFKIERPLDELAQAWTMAAEWSARYSTLAELAAAREDTLHAVLPEVLSNLWVCDDAGCTDCNPRRELRARIERELMTPWQRLLRQREAPL